MASSIKDVWATLKRNPAFLIVGVVIVAVILYMVFKSNKGNTADTTSTQPAYFLNYNAIEDNDHPHPLPTTPPGSPPDLQGGPGPGPTPPPPKPGPCRSPMGGPCPLIPYGQYKGPSYSNLAPNTYYTYNNVKYLLAAGGGGRLWGKTGNSQVLLYAPRSYYP